MKNIGKFLPSIIPVVVLIVGTFAPQIQAAIAAHPSVALALGGIYSVLTHILPSPVK